MESIIWFPPLLSAQQTVAKANVEPSVENHFPGDPQRTWWEVDYGEPTK